MKNKYLALFPLLIIVVLGWYFLGKNTPKPNISLQKPNIQSQVEGITAVQTNPQTGEIEYTLTAKSLTQNIHGQNELIDINMDWTPDKTSSYTITAKRAYLDQNTGEFEFGEGFSLQQHNQDNAITLTGEILTGNTKTKKIHSQTPLTITQGANKFFAKSMTADLTTKDYEFFGIDTTFTPPTRQDKALF